MPDRGEDVSKHEILPTLRILFRVHQLGRSNRPRHLSHYRFRFSIVEGSLAAALRYLCIALGAWSGLVGAQRKVVCKAGYGASLRCLPYAPSWVCPSRRCCTYESGMISLYIVSLMPRPWLELYILACFSDRATCDHILNLHDIA